MARTLRYSASIAGMVAACVLFGSIRASWSQPISGADVPATPKPKADVPKYPDVEKALEKFNQRAFDEAEKALEDAVLRHPELPPAQVIMAQWFAQANQAFLMRMALEKSILKSATDPEAFVIFGNIALQDRRVTEAALLFAKAKELLTTFKQPGERKSILEPQTISGLAAVAEAREEWATAQSNLETLLKLVSDRKAGGKEEEAKKNQETAVALQRLARALFQQKKPAESLTKLREAAAADKENVLTPEAALARFYEQYGDHANAVKWMANALKAAPEDLRTRLVEGQWALETGDLKEAETHAMKAKTIDPKSVDAKILHGVIELFKKDYKGAEKDFEDAHLMTPGNFAATNNLALALCEQKDDAKLRKALEYASTNFQSNQKNPEAASTLGWVWYKNKDLDKAQQALQIAIQSGNLSADTAYYVAQVLFDRSQLTNDKTQKDQAKSFLEAAVKNTRPFSMRPEAQILLDKLNKDAPAKKDGDTPKKP
jgi:Tfp pilus assembly protein PilF